MSLERPPHIPRDWWYRASWKARQAAVDAHRRATRLTVEQDEERRIAALRARVEAERVAHEARYRPQPPQPEPPAVHGLRKGFMLRSERVRLLESMLTPGYDPALILAEMGCKVATIIRACEREGRSDLAAIFRPLEAPRYKHPCRDCGTPVNHGYARCVRCAGRARVRVAS